MKQFAGDVILYMCSKSHDHVIYASWDTEWDRQNFLMFFASCCPFTTLTPHPSPLMIPEKQSLEQKRKKCLEILSFYTYMYAINEHHDIWFLKCKVWLTQIFVILCNFLPSQFHDSSENQNSKIEKITWRYYDFTHFPNKWQPYDKWFLRYGAWRK